jgi:predicted nucleotidyltransferase
VPDDPLELSVVDAVDAIERAGIPYVVIGGLASSLLGRPRRTRDVDLLVARDDADRALEALAEAGFETDRTDPRWLYKAFMRDVLVDVMFSMMDTVHLDDDMLAHARTGDFYGRSLRVVGPEDVLVVKAISYAEHSPRHWWDALGIVTNSDLDWDYVVRRARFGPRRVLSLLIYAQAEDRLVPQDVIERIYALAYRCNDAGEAR